ncbi:efflux RND transporter periplasmic adaptor subunit [Parasedimentitalea huanghaiensis]|uniref:Efflux RND transporter periplasmic adaptor subunit n=1 Tax=Parasedimentitalea huanghaiensis TaxID=2682100 RepID=A0A6L6WE78_9RHOB|nr:efflux RND transporter periplasmic adaptor subunit [Zongyanglinia huanghaiensis]MVO14875.1 efflux RND transporter periplasmic adaptor subunit [Zongyanglinia huanghaiensis]
MRLIPLLTAIVVAASLYMLVIERDALMAFALGENPETPIASTEDVVADPVESSTEVAENRIGVVVLRSESRALDSAVILRGQTQAARQVEVRAETSATVISEPLRKGAQVKTGDLLCQLAPGTRQAAMLEAQARLSEARSRVPEAEARLEEARARLKEAQINNNASRKLSEGGYVSDTRLAATQAAERAAIAGIASAETGLQTTSAGIESAVAAVAAAQTEIDRLNITAPFDGLLESDTAELGSLMQPGSLCATVIQLDTIKVVGFVPETEVNRIQVGALARAELAAGQLVQGEVTFLSRSADPSTRTFEVQVTVSNANLSIRDGQTADIAISAPGDRAHKLPQSSLTLNNEGQLGVRVVNHNQVVVFYPVKLLRDEADGVWISGLPEVADVIVVGQDFVVDGVPVTPTYREASQ